MRDSYRGCLLGLSSMRHHSNTSRRIQLCPRTDLTILLNFRGRRPQNVFQTILRGNRPLKFRPINTRRDRRLNWTLKTIARHRAPTILRGPRTTNASVLRDTNIFIPNGNVNNIFTLQPLNGVEKVTHTRIGLPLILPPYTRINANKNSINRLLLFRHYHRRNTTLKLRFRHNTKTTIPPIIPFRYRSTTTKTRIYNLLTTLQLARTYRRRHIQTRPILQNTMSRDSVVRGFHEVFRERYTISLPGGTKCFPTRFIRRAGDKTTTRRFIRYLFFNTSSRR